MEVKSKELGINLILGGHRGLEVFEVKNWRLVVGLKCSDRTGSRRISCTFTVLSYQHVVIFTDDRADSNESACLIGGFLGDDINAEIATIDGGELEDFSKPLFGGLIVPLPHIGAGTAQAISGGD